MPSTTEAAEEAKVNSSEATGGEVLGEKLSTLLGH